MQSKDYDFFCPSKAQTAPEEILLIIFKHLELRDRLMARLVCRKWNEACNDKYFQTKEKFSIEKLYMNHLSKVLLIFTFVNREHLNFEFHGMNFENYPTFFWEICGPRIYSLRFIECELSVETFWHILKSCTKLQKLTLHLWGDRFINSTGVQEYRTKDLNLQPMVVENLINPVVQSLELRFRGLKQQWSRWLVQLFQLFPCIKRFEFYGGEYCLDYEIMDPLHLASINEALSRGHIEDLRLVVYQYQYRELDWKVLASRLQLTILTEVAVHINDNTDKHLLATFLRRQANLEILHFLLRTTNNNIALNEAITIIFTNCIKLKDLKMTAVHRISWGSKWFKLLAESSVTTLKIECDDITFPEMNKYPFNITMQNLDVHFRSYFNASTIPLIEAFSSLRVVTLFKVTEKIMQTILRQQQHLKVFSARFKTRLISKSLNSDESETASDCYRPLNFAMLQVERLNIPADLPKTTSFLSSNLRYLHLYPPMGEVFYNPLSLNTSVSPLLEEIVIDTSCFSYPFEGTFLGNVINFITPLKRLWYMYLTSRTRLVYSTDMPYLADKDVRSVFNCCPSLRCFIYKRIYFRNTFEQQLVTIEVNEKLSKILPTLEFKNIPMHF